MDELKELLNSEDSDFIHKAFREDEDSVEFRINVKNRLEFERWRQMYCSKTNTCFNSKTLRPTTGVAKTFSQILICHHAIKHKGKKKTWTGCPVSMDVSIRAIHKRSARQDKLLKDFPCYIKIHGKHNHTTQSGNLLSQLRVLPNTRELFVKYFEQGMSTAQAARHHMAKMVLGDDVTGQANHAICPSQRAIAYMRDTWMKQQKGGLNIKSMFESIEQFANENPEVTIEVEKNDKQYYVVLITPFMKRVHSELRESGEVVFVNATGCMNKLNTSVIPFLCAGPAGAAPLAILFTSSREESVLTKGYGMIKKCLGDSAFFGKGTPMAFVTDNCEAGRKALEATWPDAQYFLCIFNFLQQIWHWLLNSKNEVEKNHRLELMEFVKALVYARSTTSFTQEWTLFHMSLLSTRYPNFTRHMTTLIERRSEWGIAFRAKEMLQGHYNNNFCEATVSLIKAVVYSRCKAYNTSQLVVFMVEIFDVYMQQRLVDVALKRRRVKPINSGRFSMEMVTTLGYGKFQVQSKSPSREIYEADLSIGLCNCVKGENNEKGIICKHQAACAEFSMTVVPQRFVLSNEYRQWLTALANGKDKPIKETFSTSQSEPYPDAMNCRPEPTEMEVTPTDHHTDPIKPIIQNQNYMSNVDYFHDVIPNVQASVQIQPQAFNTSTHASSTGNHALNTGNHASNTGNHPSSTINHPSNTVNHPSNTVNHPSNTVNHPSNTVNHPSNTVNHPLNTTNHPLSVGNHPSNAGNHPLNTGNHPSNTSNHPSNTSTHPSNTTTHPSNTNTHEATLLNDAQHTSNTLITAVTKLGNDDTRVALRRLHESLIAVKTTNQLNNLLFTLGSPEYYIPTFTDYHRNLHSGYLG